MKSPLSNPAVLSLIAAVLAGCAVSLPGITSGQIGCAEADISVTDDKPNGLTRTWTANCHGRTYYCSLLSLGHSIDVGCKESASSTPGESAGSSSSRGCKYDTQCKGDRICVRGACADPPGSGPAAADDGGAH
jgi:hypothetical protein